MDRRRCTHAAGIRPSAFVSRVEDQLRLGKVLSGGASLGEVLTTFARALTLILSSALPQSAADIHAYFVRLYGQQTRIANLPRKLDHLPNPSHSHPLYSTGSEPNFHPFSAPVGIDSGRAGILMSKQLLRVDVALLFVEPAG